MQNRGLVAQYTIFYTAMHPIDRAYKNSSLASKTEIFWLRVLLTFTVGLLIAGVLLPMITLTKFVFFKDVFSIASGVIQLLKSRQISLFLVISFFSIVLPMFKIIVLYVVLANMQAATARTQYYLHLMHQYGRWAMLDVMIIAILIITVKLGIIANIKVHSGLHVFVAAVLLIMLMTKRIVSLYAPLKKTQPIDRTAENRNLVSKAQVFWLRVLLTFTVGLLIAGVSLPMITIAKFIFFQNAFSIAPGVIQLLKSGQIMLFLIISFFSIVLPVFQIIILYAVLANIQLATARTQYYLHLMHEYGKWAMLDVMVIAILIVIVKLNVMAEIKVHSGLYVFVAAVLLIMLLTTKIASLKPPLKEDASIAN